MSPKLSPYGFDFGRYLRLLVRPNVRLRPTIRQPHNEVFPESGLIHMPGAATPELCDEVIADYERFEELRCRVGCAIRDRDGRNYRVANLHLRSKAMRRIGLTRAFHEAAGNFFGAPSTIYTSLYFKHGSQQSPHIDTPFFWTRPFNFFVGVWVALEDVAEQAGPLIYYPGSHRLFDSEQALRDVFEKAGQDVHGMFALMRDDVEQHCKPQKVVIEKGDAVIWHPGLMHGGSPATQASLTRHSNVFHFAPLGVNVRDHRVFPRDFANVPTYGIVKEAGGYYCRASLPATMI
jgi:phytanoyl-CoA hydroxylase